MDSNSGSRSSSPHLVRPSTPSNGKNITTRRNADRERELQQLKTRGVVALLNKTFDSQDNYVLAPASPPNPSLSPSSATNHSNRSGRKSISSGTTDFHLDGITRISTKQQQQNMLYDDALMTSPSDIAANIGLPLRKAKSHYHLVEAKAQDILKDSNNEDYDATLFHIDNHSFLINQYKHMAQHIQQTNDQLASCQLEQQQMENSTRQILETSLTQKEEEVAKVHQLSTMVLKQDRVIHELEFALSSVLADNGRLHQQQVNSNKNDCLDKDDDDMDSNQVTHDEIVDMRRELEELRLNRTDYEKRILSLCSELESSQDETRRLTTLMEKINQQCHEQQLQIDEKIEKMMRQLANKDDVIRKYRDGGCYNMDTQQDIWHDNQPVVDRSSLVRSTVSMDNIRSTSGNGIPPPAGPPPSSPLPALPVVGVSTTQVNPVHIGIIEQQQQKEQLSSSHDLTSEDELYENVLTPSMEILLLQAPSSYCLDEETLMMDNAHREYTEQLQNRLSISKEIDHLEVWDHAALERLQRQQQLKRTSLAPTTTTTTSSSKWSDRSSSAFESDWDDKQGHSTFWKGMKKKLRV